MTVGRIVKKYASEVGWCWEHFFLLRGEDDCTLYADVLRATYFLCVPLLTWEVFTTRVVCLMADGLARIFCTRCPIQWIICGVEVCATRVDGSFKNLSLGTQRYSCCCFSVGLVGAVSIFKCLDRCFKSTYELVCVIAEPLSF